MEQPPIDQPSFRRILTGAVVAPLIIMALLAGALLWQIDSYRAATRAVIQSDRTIAQANLLQRLLVDTETGLRGYLLTGADELLIPYSQALPQIGTIAGDLNTRVADQPEQVNRIKQTLRDFDQWRQYADRALQISKDGGDPIPLVASGASKRRMDSIRAQMGAFIQSEENLRNMRAETAQQTAQIVIYTGLGLVLIVGVLLGFFSRRQLVMLSHSYNQAFALAGERAAQVAEQRERLRVTLASIGDAVIVTDTDGKVTFANPAAQTLTGWTDADLLGQPLDRAFTIIDEESRQAENPITRVIREGIVVGLANHTIMVDRHGAEVPIDDSAAPIRDASGKIVGVVLVFRDITKRKLADEAIQQSEERFRLVFENAPIGICLARDGKILYGNQALATMFGYTGGGELPGLRLTDLVALDERAKLADWNRRRQQGELVPRSYELIGLRRDGTLFPYAVDVDRVMLPDGPTAVAFCTDISERQRADAALRASEQRYRDLADAMPMVVWTAKPNGEVDYFNQRWLDYTGLTLEQSRGWGWQQVLHPDDLQNAIARWSEAVNTGQPYEIEYRWRCADGVYRWQLVRALPVRDDTGQIAYWVGTAADIDGQKRVEDQQRLLAEASVLLVGSLDYEATMARLTRLAVPRLADWCAVHILEEHGDIRRLAFAHIDPAKQALVGDRPERYALEPSAQHIVSQVLRSGEPELYSEVPDSMLVEAARDQAHLETLRALGFTSYMCLPMVARGHVLGTITFVTAESGRRYDKAELAFGEDLTSRAAIALDNARLYADAEAARRRLAFLAQASEILSSSLEYESRLKSLADLAVPYLADWCIIDMVQEDGSVERLKIALADPSKERLARQLQLHHPVLKPDSHHTILNVLRTGRSWIDPEVSDARLAGEGRDPEHVEILRKLGFKSEMVVPLVARERVLGTITFVYGTPGRSYGPTELALAEDLARRAAAAVDNARLYREAQAAVRARDQFLSIASHELKTPLTSLMGYIDLMQRRAARSGDLAERDRRAIRVVGEQATRLNKLVGALLDLSRIETGQLSIERGLVDLNALTRQLVEEARPTTDRHTITFSGSDEPIMLLGDELRIEQVVQNLIQNAIKYSPIGGVVTVQVGRDGDNACIRVSDQGIGIPDGALPQLFRRFYRAPNADSQHISGMGIGLYVVKEIVELHGGTVEVVSQEGQGSTFTICMPLLAVD